MTFGPSVGLLVRPLVRSLVTLGTMQCSNSDATHFRCFGWVPWLVGPSVHPSVDPSTRPLIPPLVRLLVCWSVLRSIHRSNRNAFIIVENWNIYSAELVAQLISIALDASSHLFKKVCTSVGVTVHLFKGSRDCSNKAVLIHFFLFSN